MTEGKTLMAYGIGGRINADIFAVKRDKIFVILGLLERTEMVRRMATKKHTVITLVNWSKYQIEETLSGHKPDTERTREKKGKEREEEIALPEELETPDFRKAWSEWTEYRRESKKKLTKSTITRQLGSLAKLVIVDYLQLVSAGKRSSGNRVQEVGEISRGLKKMALELDVPVIALAQLNRAIEQDATRVPRLSDLRESGSIEADSDAVLFIHCQNPSVNQDGRLLCQIVVSKNRSGRQGMFDICFVRDFSRFEDWRDHQDLVDMAEKMAEAKAKPKSGRTAWRSAKR